MMIDLKTDFKRLITELSKQIDLYKIPKSNEADFENFKNEYANHEVFFRNIDDIEFDVSKYFHENFSLFDISQKHYSNKDISNIGNGNILIKQVCDAYEANLLKTNIQDITFNISDKIDNKLLHFSIPKIIQLICDSKNEILSLSKKLLRDTKDLSFEVGYFKIDCGKSTGFWHDDYTLFSNKILNNNFWKKLLLNFHIALSDIKDEISSPVSFIRGTEKIVYARAAIKFFIENNIKFDEEKFLKAVYLTENLYRPGEEIKANFIGMIPSLSYRYYKFEENPENYSVFFNKMKQGYAQIFSPHLMHTAPFENTQNIPRESLVLRFLAGGEYNFRNIVSLKDIIRNLSLAINRELKLSEFANHFFNNIENVSLNSKVYMNLFINKSEEYNTNTSDILRIYYDDLYKFFDCNQK